MVRLLLLLGFVLWVGVMEADRVYLPLIENGGPAISATAWVVPTVTPAPPPPNKGE